MMTTICKLKKKIAVNGVSEEWNTHACFTFTLSEENELVFQCRARYKRKNTYFETICLDVIVCTLTRIFIVVCFNMQGSKHHIWHFDSYMSGCMAAVYMQVCCACSRQGLHGRWMRRVWGLHFLLDKEKQRTAARPGVSQSFVTLDVCPCSPAAEIRSLSQNARLCLKKNNLAFVVPEKTENINLNWTLTCFSFPVYKPVSDWLCLDAVWSL